MKSLINNCFYLSAPARRFAGLLLISIFLPFQSCMDTVPEEVLDYEDFYNTLEDADVAVLGLYGQFMELADQVVVLNELRADLMDVTPNATTYLEEINLQRPSKENPWVNVSKFYTVIQTCNDMLANFNQMLADNKLIQAEYDERYSDVAALRTWVYLQLGIHFGRVPYITEPIVSVEDLDKYKNKELDLDDLLDELIRCMESLPTLENYSDSKLVQNTLDGYSLKPFFIQKRCLMGDLYLFAAANNHPEYYYKAAVEYKKVMDSNDSDERKYKIYTYVWQGGVLNWFQVVYARGKGDDISSMNNGWKNMFAAITTDDNFLDEMIWFCAYDAKFAPRYPFTELFNPQGVNGGKYYLKPSAYAVESIWGGEVQNNNFPFDARGYTGAYELSGNDYYIQKYSLFGQTTAQIGNWFLYRAGMLNLRYAEAVNRAGYPYLAWSLVNNGISANFNYTKPDGSTYPGDSIKITGTSPFDIYPQPFYFDARWVDQPYVRGPWRSNGGIRGRANMPNVPFPAECVTLPDSILFVEKLIVREAALELGFEGHRWEDLLRIGYRLNRDTPGAGDRFFWNDNIAKKYQRSGINGVDMSAEDKWFLPLYLR
jgi:hypothetical protein